MKKRIKKNIDNLALKAELETDSNDALKFSQAALNLAHVLLVLKDVKSS